VLGVIVALSGACSHVDQARGYPPHKQEKVAQTALGQAGLPCAEAAE
jgi:hypothetical protein